MGTPALRALRALRAPPPHPTGSAGPCVTKAVLDLDQGRLPAVHLAMVLSVYRGRSRRPAPVTG